MTQVMLKKIGSKQIMGDVKRFVKDNSTEGKFFPNDRDKCIAYSVYGVADGIKTGNSTYGDWAAFTGNFGATSHISGETFAAVKCFVPEPLETMIRKALSESDAVEFAFTVEIVRRDDLAQGYEYSVIPHKQASEADPLEKLRVLIPEYKPNAPALEAPAAQKAEKPAKK